MIAVLALVVLALVAFAVLSFVVHTLLSPWLLLLAVGLLVWFKFRPRHSHQ